MAIRQFSRTRFLIFDSGRPTMNPAEALQPVAVRFSTLMFLILGVREVTGSGVLEKRVPASEARAPQL